MDFSTLKQLSKVYPILVKPFDLFDATTVTDQDIQTKIDSVIQYMNSLGQSNNDTVRSWNKVMQWVMDEGLTDSVNAKIDDMMANGTFNDLLTTLTNNLLGSEVLTTTNQDVKGAINEVKGIVDSNTASLAEKMPKVSLGNYPKLTGEIDDTGRFQRAWSDMGTPASGIFYIPDGVYSISSTLTFDGGYSGVSSDRTIAKGRQFKIICDGSIQLTSGIGTGIIVKSAYDPYVQLHFYGGGQSTDNALQFKDITGLYFDVSGNQFAGTLYYHNGTQDSNSAVNGVKGGRILATNCGQALNMLNGIGYGAIDSVWDLKSANGSVLNNMGDITIKHYENYWNITDTSKYSLTITTSYSVHIGKLTIGGAGNLLQITNCTLTHVIIDEIMVTDATNGMIVTSSVVNVGTLITHNMSNTGLQLISGANIIVDKLFSTSDHYPFLVMPNGTASNKLTVKNAIVQNCNNWMWVESPQFTGSTLTLDNIQISGTCGAGGNSSKGLVQVDDANVTCIIRNIQDTSTITTSMYSVLIASYTQLLNTDLQYTSNLSHGIWYTSILPYLTGTTAGNIRWDMPYKKPSKKVIVVLNGYQNSSATAQTITYPSGFSYQVSILTQPSGFGATTTATTLTLPVNMASPVSGVITIEGM